jgi:broad specificity phosphatase PhoE
MNTIYLIRHGETDANKQFIVQGRMDNPLNANGIEQAKKTGEYLKAHQEHFDLIVASPLKRAYDTAKIICKTLGDQKTVLTHAGFVERNFGDFDGKRIDAEYSHRVINDEIPNMELNADLEKRVLTALKEVCHRYSNKKILIVAHSHVIKAILVKLIDDFTYTSYLFNCSINIIEYDGNAFHCPKYNINPLE